MKPTYALLFALALPLTAVAQAPADTATNYKHQLGLTASPVLDGFFKNNRSLPLGMLYKRQLTPNKALRMRLVGQYSRRDTANYPGTAPGFFPGFREGTAQYRWLAKAYGGYEWTRSISKKWSLAYGAELGVGWERYKDKFIRDFRQGTLESTETYEYKMNIVSFELRPFAGMRFEASPRLALFTEMAAPLQYSRRRDDASLQGTFPFGSVNSYNKSQYVRATWLPVQLIGASWKF